MKLEVKKELWNIPNMLTLFRLISVPVYMTMTIIGGLRGIDLYVIIGLIIMVVAASTDLFDGIIARKFNQVTRLGKVFDPFADKVMHCGALLSLTIIGYVHWAFVVAILLKELTMVVCGSILVKGGVTLQANMMGKVASAILSLGVILSFFHEFNGRVALYYVDWAIIGIAVVLSYAAFVNYGLFGLKEFKRIKEEKANGTYVDTLENDNKNEE